MFKPHAGSDESWVHRISVVWDSTQARNKQISAVDYEKLYQVKLQLLDYQPMSNDNSQNYYNCIYFAPNQSLTK